MFDEFKKSWQGQSAELPNIDELKNAIKKQRIGLRNKYLFAIATLVGTIVLGVVLWVLIPFTYVTTKLAFVILGVTIILATLYLAYLKFQLPETIDSLRPSQDFAKDWMNYQRKVERYNAVFINGYMIVLSIGMGLYLYEVTAGSFWFRVFAYGSTLAWLLYVALVLTPKQKRKTQESVRQIIENYQQIKNQF